MKGFRGELQRCQYEVVSGSECGEPAIAEWHWGSKKLHVCETHDKLYWISEKFDGAYPSTSTKNIDNRQPIVM